MALWESNPKPKKRPRMARRPGAGSSSGGRRSGGPAGGSGASRSGGRSGSGSGSGGRPPKFGSKRSIISGGILRDYPFLRRFYQHQAVISDSSLADDSEITIDIDQIGSSTAGAGLKVYLIGKRT